MTFVLINSEVRPLTMELAIKHRDTVASPTEREVNPLRIKHLTEKFKAGYAVPFHWATAKLGENIFRMNGLHSSTALSGLNGSFPEKLVVHFDEYSVETKDDLAVLFRQFDDRKSSRTPSDVAGAYQGLFDNLADISRPTAKLGLEGYAWWAKNVEGLPVPKGDDLFSMFGEQNLHDFLHFLGEIYSIKTPEMKRPQVAAALYATFSSNQADARKFWGDVARGGTTDDSEASTVLDTWLKEVKEDEDCIPNFKPGHLYQGCIYAWNAFRDHKTLTSIRYDVRKGFLKTI